MADSTPLLRSAPSTEKIAASSVDDTIEGSTGIVQLLQAIFISLAWAFDAQQTFISAFTDAEPKWHCTSTADPTCSSAPNPCGLPDVSWAWDHPKHTSMVSEWGVQCSSPAILGLPASSYFVGCLAGGFALGTLADSRFGRKNMLFFSCLTMSLTGALAIFSPNIWVYSALRFVCGVGRSTVGTSALVLTTEIVGKRWRDRVSVIGFFCFTLGFLSLPAMAYVGRGSSWRTLYLWASIPSLFYSICFHFLALESPRWLIINSSSSDQENVFSSMRILWEKRWAFRRLAAIMSVGFGVGIVYYGMPLNVGNLGSNLYLSVTYNALAELPSALATFFLIGSLSRRSSTIAFTTISGVCSIMCCFVTSEGIRMAGELVSFFSACTAFNVVLIYSIELFPTCVRNSAISMLRQSIVFGGVFAPMLVAAGRKQTFLSFGVFGLLIGCCGLFVACLPETKGRSICDTMEEEESAQEVVSFNNNA